MPARKYHGASIGDDELYEKVRDQGASREKAARIANAAANTSRTQVSRRAVSRAPTTTGRSPGCASGLWRSASVVGRR